MLESKIILSLGLSNLVALAAIFWKISRGAGAIERIMRDFPPHRHVGEEIIYPAGLDPGKPRMLHWSKHE